MIAFYIILLIIISILATFSFYWLALNHRTAFLSVGGVILLLGLFAYATPNFNSCGWIAFIEGCATINKTLSAFFPSRGGYDNDDNKTKVMMQSDNEYSKTNEKQKNEDEHPKGISEGEKEDDKTVKSNVQLEKECVNHSVFVSVLYWFFHLLAFLYVVSIAIAILGIEFINLLRIKFINKPQNVFWGIYDEAMMLYESSKKDTDCNINKNNVVFVLPKDTRTWLKVNEDNKGIRTLMRKGLTWIIGDASDINLLKMAQRHFFLSPDSHNNVVLAEKLIKELKKVVVPKEVSIYVRAYALAEDDVLYKWADANNRSNSYINIEIIREEAIVSRKFLLDYPMLDCPGISIDTEHATADGEFRILVIGFGILGERLMSDMICDAQFLKSSGERIPIIVDVVDKSSASYGWFKENCLDACDRYNINFKTMDAGSECFWNYLIKNELPYNRILICTPDDSYNLKLANDISNIYAIKFKIYGNDLGKRIFARVRNHELAISLPSHIMKENNENNKAIWERPFHIFGDIADAYAIKYLLNDKWNSGAICLNNIYDSSTNLSPEKKWQQASMLDKESSRASVYFQRNLLRLMGYVAMSEEPSFEIIREQKIRIIPKEQLNTIKAKMLDKKYYLILSEAEHCRWMAFFFARGWKAWEPTEEELSKLSEGKMRVKPNSMKEKAHIHANLFDFNKLDEKDMTFNKVNRSNGQKNIDSKSKDFDLVSGLESLYEAGFFVAEKEE